MKCSSRKTCKGGHGYGEGIRGSALNEVQFPKDLQAPLLSPSCIARTALNEVQFPKDLQGSWLVTT